MSEAEFLESGRLSDRSFSDFDSENFIAAALTLGTQIKTKTGPGRDDKREKGNGELKRQLFHVLFPLSVVRTARNKNSNALTRRIGVCFPAYAFRRKIFMPQASERARPRAGPSLAAPARPERGGSFRAGKPD